MTYPDRSEPRVPPPTLCARCGQPVPEDQREHPACATQGRTAVCSEGHPNDTTEPPGARIRCRTCWDQRHVVNLIVVPGDP